MTLSTGELLARLAETLRTDIGPAIDDEYTRTQAFMAAVILQRIGRQVDLSPAHAAAEADDLARLGVDLRDLLESAPDGVSVPDEVVAAVATAESAGRLDALTGVIEAIYRWGPDQPAAAAMLDRIRTVLRRDIDRRMEIAR